MNWAFIIAFIFLFLLLMFFFTKIKIHINLYHGQDNDDVQIKFIALFGLIRHKKHFPIIKIAEHSPTIVVKERTESTMKKKEEIRQISVDDLITFFEKANDLLKQVVGLHTIIRKFLNKVIVTKLEWESVIGVSDAASTAVLTGALWAVKGSFIGFVSANTQLRETPYVMVTPHFNMPISQTSFQCMIHFRVGQAIFAGIKLVKFWKGGRLHFWKKTSAIVANDTTNSV